MTYILSLVKSKPQNSKLKQEIVESDQKKSEDCFNEKTTKLAKGSPNLINENFFRSILQEIVSEKGEFDSEKRACEQLIGLLRTKESTNEHLVDLE